MAVLVRRLGGVNSPEITDELVDGAWWEVDEDKTLIVFDAEGTPIAEYRQYKWDSALLTITSEDVAAFIVGLAHDALDDLIDACYDADEADAYLEDAERAAYAEKEARESE